MADRTVVLSQNGRHAVRGLSVNNPSEFSAYQDDDDDLTYIVDLSAYLDGATITVVTRVPQGVFISGSSNTTTRLTQRLRGFGYVDFKVHTSAGDVEEFRINILRRTGSKVVLGASGGGGTAVSDGDKGDIVVSGTGATWTIDPAVLTAAGRALIDDATTLAQQQTLGAFDTVAAVNAATIDSTVNHCRTAGYYANGDGGGALYRRSPALSPAVYRITSNAGTVYWELVPEVDGSISVAQLGADAAQTATNETTCINNALTTANTLGAKIVRLIRGRIHTVNGTIIVPAGIQLVGDRAATIRRAASTSTFDIVSLGTASALRGVVVDGNRSATGIAQTINAVSVRISTANDATVEDCDLINSAGCGVVVNSGAATNGLRANILNNRISNFYEHGIFLVGLTDNAERRHRIVGNRIAQVGWGAIVVQYCDYTEIANNDIRGIVLGGRDQRMLVSQTTSTTVTRQSGAALTTAQVGNFLVVNNGVEYRIVDIAGNVLTLTNPDGSAPTIPVLSNVEATVGSGDLIGITASSHCRIMNNVVQSCSTYGFGFSRAAVVDCSNNLAAQNLVNFTGKNAIHLGNSGSGNVRNNTIASNKIFNAGYGGGIGTNDSPAIRIDSVASGVVVNTHICDNTIVSSAGAGQTTFWLSFDANCDVGSVSINGNRTIDLANNTIQNDVKSITLANWGTGATTSSIVSTGNAVQFRLDAGSTPPYTTTPDFIINKVVCTPSATPLVFAKSINNAGGALLNTMWAENNSVKGAWRAYMITTTAPAAGHIYFFQCHAV